MPSITTFLTFKDQAEAAVRHYVSIFPDSRITEVTRYGDAVPPMAGMVMTMTFELMGREYVALNAGQDFGGFTAAFSLAVLCDTQEEVDRFWAALTDGGQEVACGWLVDRFGVSWQVTPRLLPERIKSGEPARVQRMMTAMMGMKKLDLAALERAYLEG